MAYTSGARARELGLGHSGTLSDPNLDYVFHGEVTEDALKKVLNRDPTPEELAQAIEIANHPKNVALDQLIREVYGEGVKRGVKQGSSDRQDTGNLNRRMAGEVLAGSGGLAALLAAIDYVDGPEKGYI